MKILIKVGGSLLDDPESQQSLAAQIAQTGREHQTVVVHGGGKQVTRFLEAQGVQSEFVKGMRVSGSAVIDALTKVVAGSVNKNLVCAITAAGASAFGISGVDGLLTSAVQLAPELEHVGRPVKTDGRLLNLLIKSGYLPVIACVAGDAQGTIFNVNADQMAVSCASAWLPDKLLFLTDVAGVRSATGEIVRLLDTFRMDELIRSGVAHGGMQAKLEAAALALDSGINEVIIAPGSESNVCQRILKGEPIGTRLCASRQAALQA